MHFAGDKDIAYFSIAFEIIRFTQWLNNKWMERNVQDHQWIIGGNIFGTDPLYFVLKKLLSAAEKTATNCQRNIICSQKQFVNHYNRVIKGNLNI